MDAGGTWQRLLHTPTTWIVVAVVLFVVAVVLLVAGARAGRAARRQREAAVAAAVTPAGPADGGGVGDVGDDEPVTEPALPRRDPAPSGAFEAAHEEPAAEADVEDEEDPVTEPSVPRAGAVADAAHDPAARRLLAVLLTDPAAALAGVAALERGEDPGPAAVGLLRSGVPAPAVASLCGVAPDDLGDLVAAALGILPEHDRAAAADVADPDGSGTDEPAPAPERAAAPIS